MPVFISHRTADDAKAQALALRLKTKHNILSYLDHFDPAASTTKKITDLLVDRINTCTHLMALITNQTVGSWWVPFEIGVARQGDRRITSFDNSTVALPEYLTEWPVLKSDADLDNQRVGGMVTLTFANRSQIIINLQKPLHEVWMAARSGGFHYKWDGHCWMDTKGHGEFFAHLSQCASEQAGQVLVFSS